MTKERREYVQIALAYNIIMLAAAGISVLLSLWLLLTGRLLHEGVDGNFLFTVGLVAAAIFLSVPIRSIQEGLLRDLKVLWRERAQPTTQVRRDNERAWWQSPAHQKLPGGRVFQSNMALSLKDGANPTRGMW